MNFKGGGLIISNRNNKQKLTIEDYILLHLFDNKYNHGEHIVTELITEKGIQGKLNCGLGYISRILKKNEDEGYIYRKLMRIENNKRKRYAFFLTDDGLKLAEEIRKKNLNGD